MFGYCSVRGKSVVQAIRFSKSSLGKLLASTSFSNETVRDTESSGLLAIRYAKRGMVSFVYSGRIKVGPKREITIGRYPEPVLTKLRIEPQSSVSSAG